MAIVANKRSIMTLYSGGLDIYSHQVRIVLAEKGVSVDVIDVNAKHHPEDLAELNPYNSVPTLVDRDLILYEARIIMEYLDERFPHPPLMPVYPVARANCRLMMYRIERDWYSLLHKIINKVDAKTSAQAAKELTDSLLGVSPLFSEHPFFLSDEFTLVDCCLGPLLWRLPMLGINLPVQAKAIKTYMKRIFDRDMFQASLSDVERELMQASSIK